MWMNNIWMDTIILHVRYAVRPINQRMMFLTYSKLYVKGPYFKGPYTHLYYNENIIQMGYRWEYSTRLFSVLKKTS